MRLGAKMSYNALLLGAYLYAAEFESVVEDDSLLCLGVIGTMWSLFVGYLLYSLMFGDDGESLCGEER